MKCRYCNSCKRGFFKSKPDKYVCTGVKEPFVVENIEKECSEYPDKRDAENPSPVSLSEYIIMIINDELSKRGL